MKNIILVLIVAAVVIVLVSLLTKKESSQVYQPTKEPSPAARSEGLSPSPSSPPAALKPPPMNIDQSKKYSAVLKTSQGEMVVELTANKTPVTVNNFVYLGRSGFYDNTIFHRVIRGFMIQGGDPKGDGSGGPGYRFDDEPFEGEYTRGPVAMANAGPDTNGSQFFIMHQDYNLLKNYVIFGTVVRGLEVLDKIAAEVVAPNAVGEVSKPINPARIISVEMKEE